MSADWEHIAIAIINGGSLITVAWIGYRAGKRNGNK